MANNLQIKYYIHSPSNWDEEDVKKIREELKRLNAKPSVDAAIGEGLGGHGFETVVEFLLNNPVTAGLISAFVYDVAKIMIKHRPRKDATPEGFPETYRLVVHVDTNEVNTTIGINLDNDQKSIEVAINDRLEDKLKEGRSKIEQVDDSWEDYGF